MISFNIILAFLLSLPINPLTYPSGYNYVISWGPKIVFIVITTKFIDLCFSIHIRLLAWMYRNNLRTIFKIYVYLILHFDQISHLHIQFLLNACMWHAMSKNDNNLLSFLLECEANPNIVFQESESILLYPLIYNSIEYKCTYPKKSLLAEACQKNNTTLATILLQHHADPDGNVLYYEPGCYIGDSQVYYSSTINDCRNPLLIACHNNNSQIVKELIHHNTKTHPFTDSMCMRLQNTDIINMGDRSAILKDHMRALKEIPVTAIGFTLCHKNRDLFNTLLSYTLEKNKILPSHYPFIQFALFHQQENCLLQLLPDDVKKIIWSHVFDDFTYTNIIEKCFARKGSTWSKNHNHKISISINLSEKEYWKNKLEHIGFYSPLKVTNFNKNE